MGKEDLMEREKAYRSNVSLITFQGPKFLLVNLIEWPLNYWKFPQGGVNPGETLEQAVKREFQEELGSEKIRILRESKIVRKYTWDKPRSIDNKLYVGQNQTFFIVEFLGDNRDVTLNTDEMRAYCWCGLDELESLINRKELDFQEYWKTIRNILKEQRSILNFYGIDVNEID